VRTILEGERGTESRWCDELGLTQAQVSELLRAGVLRPDREGSLRADFVGLFATPSELFLFLPKFCSGAVDHDVRSGLSIDLIVRVLRHYWRRCADGAVDTQQIEELRHQSRQLRLEYDAFHTLHRRFLREGLYRRESTHLQVSGISRIHWPKTIAATVSIHTASSVLYERPVATHRRLQVNEVSRIHASVLAHLANKYMLSAKAALMTALRHDTSLIADEDLLRSRRRWASLVQRELGTVFSSGDVSLLRLLLDFLEAKASLAGPVVSRLYGTNSFHSVWEDACSVVLGSNLHEHQSRVPRPVWVLTLPNGGGQQRYPGAKQRPDIVLRRGGDWAILDAKYYYPLPRRLCGWGDIVKQLFYAKTFDNPEGASISNGFVLPDPDVERVEHVGSVQVEHDDGRVSADVAAVEVSVVNPYVVLEAYTRAEVLPDLVEGCLAGSP